MTRRHADRSCSRRALLGSVPVAGIAAGAGCLGSLTGMSGPTTYDPEAVSTPPDGTPGELYYALEERTPDYELSVESVYENDGDLLVAYHSDASAALEDADGAGNASDEARGQGPLYNFTMEEAGVIAQAFNEICVKHGDGSDYGMLIGEIENPVTDQPWGWGAQTAWFDAYNRGEMTAVELQLSLGQYVVYEDDVESTGEPA